MGALCGKESATDSSAQPRPIGWSAPRPNNFVGKGHTLRSASGGEAAEAAKHPSPVAAATADSRVKPAETGEDPSAKNHLSATPVDAGSKESEAAKSPPLTTLEVVRNKRLEALDRPIESVGGRLSRKVLSDRSMSNRKRMEAESKKNLQAEAVAEQDEFNRFN